MPYSDVGQWFNIDFHSARYLWPSDMHLHNKEHAVWKNLFPDGNSISPIKLLSKMVQHKREDGATANATERLKLFPCPFVICISDNLRDPLFPKVRHTIHLGHQRWIDT